MSLKKYLIRYPDGSKLHVDRHERDSMLADLVQIGDREYRSTLIVRTFHSMSSLGELRERIDLEPTKSFLPGTFTIELNGQRHRELLETAAHMEFRLKTARIVAPSH